MKKVLVVATSRKTRGGITAVLKAYESTQMWKDYHCHWIGTHRDSNVFIKFWYLFRALIEFFFLLPFYDIVHFHISEKTTIRRKQLFLKMLSFYNKKVIVHLHAFSPETTIRGELKDLYHKTFKNADAVIALSPTWKREIENSFPDLNNVRVLYNPCTANVTDKVYEKKKQILYAGTVNARKGYHDMIVAFSKIAKSYPNWSIVFAGNGEIEQGMNTAKELGIGNQVEFLGWLSGDEKDKAFKQASIFCLPSYAEGFPMAVLDAFSYGLPVVTTPVGGIPDIAIDGENMLLFNPGDVDTLAIQLKRLIEDENLRKHLSTESHSLATNTFNLQTVTKQLGDLYDSLV